MKQAEHPPATAGANSAAEYSLAIIDQLARIDRSRSKEEMDELVCRLLSLIGEAMLSGRVFLFERLEGIQQSVQQGIQRDERIQCTDHRHHAACLQKEQAVLAAVFLKVFRFDGTAALISPDTGIFHDRIAVEYHHQAKGELKAKKHL